MGKKLSGDLMVTSDQIQNMVRVVRGQGVLLDSDLARLYGVTTKRLNEQVARNRNRFPEDLAYQPTRQKVTFLMSQIATSRRDWGGRTGKHQIRSTKSETNSNNKIRMTETEGAAVGKKASGDLIMTSDQIQGMVRVVRGQRVMLDFDLARLYGVTTTRLNQQVARNRNRFPGDFAYQLTQQEFGALMLQNAISKAGRGGRRKLPWAFTEHGVAMLSSVLNSPTAVQVNIEIMRAFVQLRRLMGTPGELVEQLRRLAETVQLHDHHIRAIEEVLNKMMERPESPKRRIGFHVPVGEVEESTKLEIRNPKQIQNLKFK